VNISTTSLFARARSRRRSARFSSLLILGSEGAGSAAPSRNEPQPLAAGVGAEGRDDDEARVSGPLASSDSGAGKASASGLSLEPPPRSRRVLLPPPSPTRNPRTRFACASAPVLGLARAGGARDVEVGLAWLEVDSRAVEAALAPEACGRGWARVRCGVESARWHRKVLVRVERQCSAASRLGTAFVLGGRFPRAQRRQMSELGGVVLQDGIRQPPWLTGSRTRSYKRLIVGYTGAFMTQCGPVNRDAQGQVDHERPERVTAYATGH
ncbi:hypothetical protein B0H14DRAFT_2928246, partial [Mycena olivaceomarginata]